jgi:signal transduction histidine kinase
VRREGKVDLAATLYQQIERMRRQIEYHLAQARVASGSTPGVRSSVKDTADALTRVLKRLYVGRELTFHIEVPENHSVRIQREDSEEILGNLLDNACKWGNSEVMLASYLQNGGILIAIEDDGVGISPSLRESVLQRGVRADEATPVPGLDWQLFVNWWSCMADQSHSEIQQGEGQKLSCFYRGQVEIAVGAARRQ